MRAMVTGVAGFIGSTLTEQLLALGHQVMGVDALTDYYPIELKRRNLAALDHPAFRFEEGDLNLLDLDRLLQGVDVVFHLAGQPGVRSSWGSEFSSYTERNVGATQRLLEAGRRAGGLRRIVAASSSSVYGEAERYPTRETDRPAPRSPYGVTKLAAEHLCSLYGSEFGVPTVSLRFFTVYGPRQRPDMAFTRFLRAAADHTPIHIFGSGEQVRDFTYVDDIVDALLRSAEIETAPGAVFNVAGGSSVSVNEVLALISEISGEALDLRRDDAVPGDVSRTGGSTLAIRQALGWQPRVSLPEGLARQFEWVTATPSPSGANLA